jgi:sugar O-acyltransferase (sialic acid O-acetyltransferase NeuD family)
VKLTKRIVILGTGGNSIDILDTINDLNTESQHRSYDCIAFLDDNQSVWGKTVHGIPVLGPLSLATEMVDCCFVNGIGSPSNFWKKELIISRTGLALERFETLVHPSASLSRLAQLGQGTVVFQNATITSNVRIGNHVVVLPGSIISHDVTIGDYTCIAGGVSISGQVRVGTSCYLGTNSSIIGGVEIGYQSLVGMGSVVLADVPENSVVVGNPARFLRSLIANP